MFSQNGDLRFKSSCKSKSIQKFSSFPTNGFVVFTYFTDKVGQLNTGINSNDISVMILMILTIKLLKTK